MNSVTNDSASILREVPEQRGGYRVLRVWPAVLLLVLMVAARIVPKFLEGGQGRYWIVANMGPALCGILLLIWWLAASRATWKERVFGFLGVVCALVVTFLLKDPTMRGPGTMYLTAPMGLLLFGIGAVRWAKRRPVVRTGRAVLLAGVGFAFSILLRSDGMDGDYVMTTYWRWTESPEERLVAGSGASATSETRTDTTDGTNRSAVELAQGTSTNASTIAAFASAEWPEFRGRDRSGRVTGASIGTNWTAQAPRLLWKVPVGPGWSSFAVAGKRLFTQEQRGPMEVVVCYDTDSGREIWKLDVEARLDDPMGGPGPRATPTFAMIGTNEPALFAMGATGILLRADPASGEKVWGVNVKEIAGREKLPMWGYAGSPLVAHGSVIVWGGGLGDKGLLAFNVEKGTLKWSAGGAGIESYSSPQLNTIAGEPLVLQVSEAGLLAVEPASGKVRLNYEFKFNGYRSQQPTVIGDVVLMYSGMGPGSRGIQIKKSNGELVAEELWTVKNLKPDFTDFVVRGGYLYGIDGGFMVCVEAKSGERKWRDGRYGKGQVLLLENSGVVLTAAEDGRVVLLAADPQAYAELASFKALEGKTWNHPVVVGNRLYVRNAQEAACYEFPSTEAVGVKTAAR